MDPTDILIWLCEFLGKSAAAIAVGFAVITGARILSPHAKHRLWLWIICATLSIPALLAMPRWELLPTFVESQEPTEAAPNSAKTALDPIHSNLSPPTPIDQGGDKVEVFSISEKKPVDQVKTVAPEPNPDSDVAATGSLNWQQWSWIPVSIWALGLVILVVRSFFATGFLKRVERNGCQPPPKITAVFERLRNKEGASCQVALLVSPLVASPCTWGIFRTQIVLPDSAENWTPQELEMILLHELAHVVRRDALAVQISRLFLALNWLNPLAWAVLKKMERYRENACDIKVIQSGHNPICYCEMLFRQAKAASSPLLKTCAIAVASSGSVEKRIGQILNSNKTVPHKGLAATSLSGVLATFMAGFIIVVGLLGHNAGAVEKGHPENAHNHSHEPKSPARSALSVERNLASGFRLYKDEAGRVARAVYYDAPIIEFLSTRKNVQASELALFEDLSDYAHLRTVEFPYGSRLKADHLNQLSKLESVTEVTMGFPGVDSEFVTVEGGLQKMGELKNLKVLRLCIDQMNDDDLQFVRKLTGLKVLEFNAECIREEAPICTDACADILVNARSLESLTIHGGNFSNVFVEKLSKGLPNLEELFVNSLHLKKKTSPGK